MALDDEDDLLVGPAPPELSAEDELASADDRSREVLRITSYVPAPTMACHWNSGNQLGSRLLWVLNDSRLHA